MGSEQWVTLTLSGSRQVNDRGSRRSIVGESPKPSGPVTPPRTAPGVRIVPLAHLWPRLLAKLEHHDEAHLRETTLRSIGSPSAVRIDRTPAELAAFLEAEAAVG